MLSGENGSSWNSNNMKQPAIKTLLAFCKYVFINFGFKNFNLSPLEEKSQERKEDLFTCWSISIRGVVVSSFGVEMEGVDSLETQPVPDMREAGADGEVASREEAEGSMEAKAPLHQNYPNFRPKLNYGFFSPLLSIS